MADPTKLADELERLAMAATPGPWFRTTNAVPYNRRQKSAFADIGASVGTDSNRAGKVDDVVVGGLQDEQGGAVGFLRNEDADLSTFTRNHALAIVALLRAGEKLRKSVEPELLRIAAEACRRAATKEMDEVAIELFAMAEIQERAIAIYDAAKERRGG